MDKNRIRLYGNQSSVNIVIQTVDDHDISEMENEAAEVRRIAGGDDFMIAALPVDDWNMDLSPWEAPPVFGKEGFGSGASDTLSFITDTVIPFLGSEHSDPASRKFYIAGYSLAGLFALWAVCQTDIFSGAAAASPSVWFPGWIEYSEKNMIKTHSVYMSLGDREEKTKNQIMAKVGDCIRREEEIFKEKGINTVLEWNKGNHFKDSGLRTAAGIAWLLNNEGKRDV